MKFLAVLTVRNEAPFLLEWLAHHRAVGFNRFLIFSNGCDDGTDTMLDRLDELGHIKHVRNDGPYEQGGIQFTALKRADKMGYVKSADWILTLDVDEFVNIHVGDGTVTDLLEALPEATAITLTWRLFGNGGRDRYLDLPMVDTFTECAPEIMFWPWRAFMFKTLFRNDGTYKKLGVHRPRSPDENRVDGARWFDGEGRELPDLFKRQRIFSTFGQPNYRLAQLNHYALGSKESYVLKAARGRAVHADQMLDVDYWVDRNFNTATDRTIQRMSPRSRPLRAELLADPTLSRLHRASVTWRKNRFLQLLEQEPFRALYARLLVTPASIPLPRNKAGFLIAQAARARARETGPD